MHIFSCGVQDEVRIGDSMSIVILDVASDHVRVGVRSPGQHPEYQEEILYLSPGEQLTERVSGARGQLVEI